MTECAFRKGWSAPGRRQDLRVEPLASIYAVMVEKFGAGGRWSSDRLLG